MLQHGLASVGRIFDKYQNFLSQLKWLYIADKRGGVAVFMSLNANLISESKFQMAFRESRITLKLVLGGVIIDALSISSHEKTQ